MERELVQKMSQRSKTKTMPNSPNTRFGPTARPYWHGFRSTYISFFVRIRFEGPHDRSCRLLFIETLNKYSTHSPSLYLFDLALTCQFCFTRLPTFWPCASIVAISLSPGIMPNGTHWAMSLDCVEDRDYWGNDIAHTWLSGARCMLMSTPIQVGILLKSILK